MTTMTFDKLAYVDRLRAAGFNEPQARAMADGLDQALREEVATKSDIAALRNETGLFRVEIKSELGMLREELRGLKGEHGELREEFRRLEGELKGELGGLKREHGEFRGEFRRLEGELKGELGGLKREQGQFRGELAGLKGELLAAMKADKIDILKWVMMLIVGQTAVFTALKLLGR